jgi:hypothetical protein
MHAFRKHTKLVEEEAQLAHRIEAAHMYEIQLANRALQIRSAKLQKRHNILNTLPSVDHLGKYSRFLNLRYPGTNGWVRETPQYLGWVSSPDSDCLCCYGIPGSGKSIMAATVVDSLLSSQPTTSTIVCHYYCDFADFASLEPYFMIATLLKQVLEQVSLDKFTEDFDCPIQETIAMPPFEIMIQFLAKMLQDYNSV